MRSVLEELVAHLAAALDVPVSTEVPRERPSAFVVVDPVGGRSDFDALHGDYAIQAWATSYADSEALVRTVCDAMRDASATIFADPIPLGYDGTYTWWQVTYTLHALW